MAGGNNGKTRCGNDAPWKPWKSPKAKATFPLFPPRLEIPPRNPEGFPHSHSAGGETYSPGPKTPAKTKPENQNRNFLLCSEQELSTLP